MKNIISHSWLLLLLLVIAACQNEADEQEQPSINKFDDPVLVQIYEYQDKRDTDSLLQYFDHENALYRASAAEALASVQDTAALPMLFILLNDEQPKVRKAAAYAIGQVYDSAAVGPLVTALQEEDSSFVKKELLEALGKVIPQPQVQLLQSFGTSDSLEKEGLAWGLYRAGIRNVHGPVSVEIAVGLLDTSNTYLTRLGAAHFLARTKNLNLSKYSNVLAKAAVNDPAADVRMALALALSNIRSEKAKSVLLRSLAHDSDYRVRINALRALGNFKFDVTAVDMLLQDKNVNVAITAAGLIAANTKDTSYLLARADSVYNVRVKSLLLGAGLANSESPVNFSDKIKQAYQATDDPYEKAHLLSALDGYMPNYGFIVTEIFKNVPGVISTTGLNELAAIRAQGSFPSELEPSFADVFRQAMLTGDIALVAIGAGVLSDTSYHYTEMYDNHDFLYEAKGKLSLPKDNEALQVLNRTIAYFEGKEEMPETQNEYNHPIEWQLVKLIPDQLEVTVETEKGNIVLRLLVNEAPGSVLNFYRLASDGYFNGKNFHRVVPNFVIQGGCNRGDGYGGEDYSIRSEFANIRYTTGSVGMASAGKDTEGTQWFITHSPAPHLDGRYTIFAEVVNGMDVVHQTEVGDKIINIRIPDIYAKKREK